MTTSIKDVLSKLPGLRKSHDFDQIIPELRKQLDALKIVSDELRDSLRGALFDSPARVDEIRKEILRNNSEQETVQLAIEGAERRKKEAANAEMQTAVEQRMREAKKLRDSLRSKYLELHDKLSTAAELLKSIEVAEKHLQDANSFAHDHGRGDLAVASPWQAIIRDRPGYTYQHPSNSVLPGYFPLSHKHPDGAPLALMRDANRDRA